jgi:hypothetical protein
MRETLKGGRVRGFEFVRWGGFKEWVQGGGVKEWVQVGSIGL